MIIQKKFRNKLIKTYGLNDELELDSLFKSNPILIEALIKTIIYYFVFAELIKK